MSTVDISAGIRTAAASATAQPAGFRLCGIVDDPPPSSRASPDLGLHQQADVARDLAEHSGVDRRLRRPSRPAGRRRHARARPGTTGSARARAPRRRRGLSSSSAASVPEAPPNWSTSASRRRVTTRAQLRCTPRIPAGRLETERDWRRRLQQRPRQHHVAGMPIRQRPQRAGQRLLILIDQIDRARLTSRTNAVSTMSWLVAPQCTNPAALAIDRAHARGQRVDERNGDRAGAPSRRERCDAASKSLATATFAMAIAAPCGIRPSRRLHARQRDLDVEQRLQHRSVSENSCAQRIGRAQCDRSGVAPRVLTDRRTPFRGRPAGGR